MGEAMNESWGLLNLDSALWLWQEYDAAAEWCARRGFTGAIGTELPMLVSRDCIDAINADPEAFQQRVKDTAYAIAMERHV